MTPVQLAFLIALDGLALTLALVATYVLYGGPLPIEKTWPVWLAAFASMGALQVFALLMLRPRPPQKK